MPYNLEDWKHLDLELLRLYEGRPLWLDVDLPAEPVPEVCIWQMLSGSAELSARGISFRAGPGDYVVCLPGSRHQRFTEGTRLRSVHFRLEVRQGKAAWKGKHLVNLGRDLQLEAELESLYDLANEAQVCEERYHPVQPFNVGLKDWVELQARLFRFAAGLLGLLDNEGIRFEPVQQCDSRVQGSLDWLTAQPIGYRFNRADLADLFHLSPSQLDRLWRKDLQVTPRQFWEQKRIQWACRELASNELSIKEIAYQLGFLHFSHFSSWFTTRRSESPRGYRLRQLHNS